MPQSLAKIYTHLIFSTKHRERWLTNDHRAELHAYMGGTLNGVGCAPIEINYEPEHVHALFLLGRTICPSDVSTTNRCPFQDEYRAFLCRYEIEFDERYVWD